jgi:hypothetical protein
MVFRLYTGVIAHVGPLDNEDWGFSFIIVGGGGLLHLRGEDY